MRQIVINHNDNYAAPVLITEKAMRRATETYINNTKNNSAGFGDYIDEAGFVRHSDSAKIWVSFRQEGMIYLEKSCDYEPEYLHERTTR